MGFRDKLNRFYEELSGGMGIVDVWKSLGTMNVTQMNVGNGPMLQKVIIKDKGTERHKDKRTKLSDELGLQGEREVKALIRQTCYSLDQRKDLIRTLDKLRANDIVETILEVMIDDGLIAGNNNKIFETIEYIGENQPEETNIIFEAFTKKFKPDRTALGFIDEAMLYGEYALPVEGTEGIGVTKILDNPDTANIVCIYEGMEKKYFLQRNGNNIEKLDKDSHIHFVMNPRPLRVRVAEFTGWNKSDEYILPEHIKVGKSVIFPVINKIKQLQTLEMANLASDLRDILKPTIVQVGIPEKTPPDKLGEIVERFEDIFSNIYSGLQDVEELDFSDLLSVITTVRVLPAPSDGRGGFVKPDLSQATSTAEKEQTIRRAIALTVGIPFYYLSVGEQATQRLESLKLFSRYSRKLNSMQDAIITGFKDLYCLHIKLKTGRVIDHDDINITMREIVNIELLDRMEYLVALMTGLEEIIKLVAYVEENPFIDIGVNSDVLLEILNKNLSEFQGYKDLFIKKLKKRPDTSSYHDDQIEPSQPDNNVPDVPEVPKVPDLEKRSKGIYDSKITSYGEHVKKFNSHFNRLLVENKNGSRKH